MVKFVESSFESSSNVRQFACRVWWMTVVQQPRVNDIQISFKITLAELKNILTQKYISHRRNWTKRNSTQLDATQLKSTSRHPTQPRQARVLLIGWSKIVCFRWEKLSKKMDHFSHLKPTILDHIIIKNTRSRCSEEIRVSNIST